MKGRIREITAHTRQSLGTGWELCGFASGAVADPGLLPGAGGEWVPATVPGTVASSLRSAGRWSLDGAARRFDAEDWWYRTEFSLEAASAVESVVLGFDGLATLAEVWLDDHRLLQADNMFTAHEIALEGIASGPHRLAIRFASLDAHLKARRPRPRWRAPMVENQQLRWVRTTLLGRTPGWSPPAAAVGPWRDVWIERRRIVAVDHVVVRATIDGSTGMVDVGCLVRPIGSTQITSVTLSVTRGEDEWLQELMPSDEPARFVGCVTVDDAARWWPHTHGEPICYQARLLIGVEGSRESQVAASLGPIGFREIAVRSESGDFAVSVNGVDVFCRGACWSPLDCVTLGGAPDDYRRALQQVRDAGMNMLRVGGTMVYESNEFLDQCDAHGVLLWQDLMFANMDYPADDPAIAAGIESEVSAQLARLQAHPCLALVCGNSEIAQQAAMWGAPRDLWNPPLFEESLRRATAHALPTTAYVPSSAHGGDFPHQANAGPSSYYGVGAYLRPLEDARLAEVRFASECLAFANVPEPAAVVALGGETAIKVHHPRWKERVPRDLGAGWDFDDVRDHYLARLFGVDPLSLRYADHERYLELSRIASGLVMQRTFAEWRRHGSATRGGLVWFLRDLWIGAGWGVIDAAGTPKAAYWYLRRALKAQCVSISDEGVNGLMLHVINDRPTALVADLELVAFRASESPVERAGRRLKIPAHGSVRVSATDLFDGFRDLSYAYRFGPPSADLVIARLLSVDGELLSEDSFFTCGQAPMQPARLNMAVTAKRFGEKVLALTISSQRFAFGVRVEAAHWSSTEQFFSVAPDRPVTLMLSAGGLGQTTAGGKVRVQAINGDAPATASLPD